MRLSSPGARRIAGSADRRGLWRDSLAVHIITSAIEASSDAGATPLLLSRFTAAATGVFGSFPAASAGRPPQKRGWRGTRAKCPSRI